MTFGSKAFAGCVMVLMAGVIVGCSSTDQDYYGYEEEYAMPEPNMVPNTPDDKPGRTVDEMLQIQVNEVTVIPREEAEKKETLVPDQDGRFGSKEKVSLRKGLNAPPAEQMVYGNRKREDVTTVRALPLEDNRDENLLVTDSEEKILAEIIQPPQSSVQMIEVVSKDAAQEDALIKTQPSAERSVNMVEVVSKDSILEQPEAVVVTPTPAETAVSMTPIVPVAAKAPTETASVLSLTLIPPAASVDQPEEEETERFVLQLPPAEETRFQLQQPSEEQQVTLQLPPQMLEVQDDALVVSDEIGMIDFGEYSVLLPKSAAASAILKNAADAAKENTAATLLVIGYDEPAKETGKKATAEKRAKAVENALVKRGVAKNRIKTATELTAPYGESTGNHAQIYLEY